MPLLLASVPKSQHPPSLIFTGATAALKSSSHMAAFAPGKWMQRSLAQSLAKEFGPQGVHVSHTIIDGFIDTPAVREFTKINNPDVLIQPEAVSFPMTTLFGLLLMVIVDGRGLLVPSRPAEKLFHVGVGPSTQRGEVVI